MSACECAIRYFIQRSTEEAKAKRNKGIYTGTDYGDYFSFIVFFSFRFFDVSIRAAHIPTHRITKTIVQNERKKEITKKNNALLLYISVNTHWIRLQL